MICDLKPDILKDELFLLSVEVKVLIDMGHSSLHLVQLPGVGVDRPGDVVDHPAPESHEPSRHQWNHQAREYQRKLTINRASLDELLFEVFKPLVMKVIHDKLGGRSPPPR